MTNRGNRTATIDVKALLERDEDFLRCAVEALVLAELETEMSQAIGAEKDEAHGRTAGPLVGLTQPLADDPGGTLDLRVPQDRLDTSV